MPAELPRLFIASSKEALPVAEAVNIKLEKTARVKQWDNAFDLSSLTLPALVERTKQTDFAVFVFHKDDKTIIRGDVYSTVRDNVLFELGLFIGALGLVKCFILIPKSIEGEFRLPSDLAGLTTSTYDDSLEDVVDAVTTSCAKIKQLIQKFPLTSQTSIGNTSPSIDPIHMLQSELWRARVDLQRATEQMSALQNSVLNLFYAVAKPATEIEIKRWIEGAASSYTTTPHIMWRNAFFVDRDVVIPSMHGADSLTVIVAQGVRAFGLDGWGHNNVFFMDGFRMYGPFANASIR